MGVIYHPDWDLSDKGKKDVERHHKKIDDAIRKSVKDVIAEESIITKKKGKKVRIPVKGLKDYKFIHGQPGKGKGFGVGTGKDKKPGDVIGRRKKTGDGSGDGKPGNKPGEDIIEAEVDIDYLIKIMFEDLGLPWIEEKQKAQQLVPSGWKFDAIVKRGVFSRLHKKKSLLEAIKRNEVFAGEIEENTGCSHEDALRALFQADGDLNRAIEIIKTNKLDKSIDPYITIEDDDLRFRQLEQAYELHSKCVVLAMMDVSGSMTTDKKYLCRSLLFWMVEFLKKVYDFVDIRFIVHTTEAKIVDEDTFFRRMESGGTFCWTALDKAIYLMETEYSFEEYNRYLVYMSDGEDFSPEKTVPYIDKLLNMKPNMFAYIEVRPDYKSQFNYIWASSNTLIKAIKDKWKFNCTQHETAEFCKNESLHFLTGIIKNKSHIYPALKHILFKEDKK